MIQVGKPSRHHQVVGGKFQPQPARLFDEGQVLVRQRQNRNLREVDFLLTCQPQQQVERPFEPLDVDNKRRLVCRPFGLGSEGDDFGGARVSS